MKVTNKYGFPDALVNAVKNDPYDAGESDYTATGLIKPVRQLFLQKKHRDDIEEDVADRLWSLYGQVAHGILERANETALVEKRFFAEVDGYTVSAQIDTLCLDHGILSDYKFTTSFAFMAHKEPKVEWVQQMNIQAWLLRQHAYKVDKAQIIGLLRDWAPSSARTKSGYPVTQIAKMDIPLWTDAEVEFFVRNRIQAHELATDSSLVECSSEETWSGRRCSGYCSVSKWCDQYNNKGRKE